MEPRGFAFWNILDEGRSPPAAENPPSTNESVNVKEETDVEEEKIKIQPPLWLADRLNNFLQIRNFY